MVFAIFGAWWLFRPTLDPGKILIFPLADRDSEIEAGQLIAIQARAAMEDLQDLQPIDAWARLSPSERQDQTVLSASAMRRLARSQRAARYLTGSVVQSGECLVVTLEL